jgi:hypothetical protein
MMKFTLSRLLPLVVGSAAAGVLASMSPAHAVTFNWSFDGLQNTYGTFEESGGTITSWNGQVDGSPYFFQVSSLGIIDPLGGINFNDNSYPISDKGVSWRASIQYNDYYDYPILVNWNLWKNIYTDSGFGGYHLIYSVECSYLSYCSQQFPNQNGQVYAAGGYYGNFSAVAVPFDISGSTTIPAVGALLLALKARKSITSKTRTANPDVAVP